MIGFRGTALEQLSVGHEVGVNTLTGSARLTVSIRTTPGRESFGPELALCYASGEQNSTFGVGWFLSGLPSIGLDTLVAVGWFSINLILFEANTRAGSWTLAGFWFGVGSVLGAIVFLRLVRVMLPPPHAFARRD